MVNWISSGEITKNTGARLHYPDILSDKVKYPAASYSQLIHTVFGLYLCEWLINIEVEWSFIFGKKRLRWPMIFYFVNRHCLLIGLIGNLAVLNVTSPIDCQAWYIANQTFLNVSLALASILFSLRTMAISSYNRYICAALFAISAGEIALLMGGVATSGKTTWSTGHDHGCSFADHPSHLASMGYLYAASFELGLLLLLTWRFFHPSDASPRLTRKELIYIAVASAVTLVAAVLKQLALNPVMSTIADIPAAVASTIAACRIILAWQGICINADYRAPSEEGVSRFIAPSRAFMETTSFAFNNDPRTRKINFELDYSIHRPHTGRLSSSPLENPPDSPSSIGLPGYTTPHLPYEYGKSLDVVSNT